MERNVLMKKVKKNIFLVLFCFKFIVAMEEDRYDFKVRCFTPAVHINNTNFFPAQQLSLVGSRNRQQCESWKYIYSDDAGESAHMCVSSLFRDDKNSPIVGFLPLGDLQVSVKRINVPKGGSSAMAYAVNHTCLEHLKKKRKLFMFIPICSGGMNENGDFISVEGLFWKIKSIKESVPKLKKHFSDEVPIIAFFPKSNEESVKLYNGFLKCENVRFVFPSSSSNLEEIIEDCSKDVCNDNQYDEFINKFESYDPMLFNLNNREAVRKKDLEEQILFIKHCIEYLDKHFIDSRELFKEFLLMWRNAVQVNQLYKISAGDESWYSSLSSFTKKIYPKMSDNVFGQVIDDLVQEIFNLRNFEGTKKCYLDALNLLISETESQEFYGSLKPLFSWEGAMKFGKKEFISLIKQKIITKNAKSQVTKNIIPELECYDEDKWSQLIVKIDKKVKVQYQFLSEKEETFRKFDSDEKDLHEKVSWMSESFVNKQYNDEIKKWFFQYQDELVKLYLCYQKNENFIKISDNIDKIIENGMNLKHFFETVMQCNDNDNMLLLMMLYDIIEKKNSILEPNNMQVMFFHFLEFYCYTMSEPDIIINFLSYLNMNFSNNSKNYNFMITLLKAVQNIFYHKRCLFYFVYIFDGLRDKLCSFLINKEITLPFFTAYNKYDQLFLYQMLFDYFNAEKDIQGKDILLKKMANFFCNLPVLLQSKLIDFYSENTKQILILNAVKALYNSGKVLYWETAGYNKLSEMKELKKKLDSITFKSES